MNDDARRTDDTNEEKENISIESKINRYFINIVFSIWLRGALGIPSRDIVSMS